MARGGKPRRSGTGTGFLNVFPISDLPSSHARRSCLIVVGAILVCVTCWWYLVLRCGPGVFLIGTLSFTDVTAVLQYVECQRVTMFTSWNPLGVLPLRQ